jgi:hypothetical protein
MCWYAGRDSHFKNLEQHYLQLVITFTTILRKDITFFKVLIPGHVLVHCRALYGSLI